MKSVNFYRTYHLNEIYKHVKAQSYKIIGKYLDYPDLFRFNDEEKSLTFKSERLIPKQYTTRPRIMFLFSNPHPHSVHQGMLLSPNTRGKENPFWETMRNAGWINFREKMNNPQQAANLCFECDYEGPFDFIFYTYYAFPTNYPNKIKKIFGKVYFDKVIQPEAREDFERTILENNVEAVVVFNKDIFNLVSEKPVGKYIDRLINVEMIESQVKDLEEKKPTFLTFPTGWRYHKEIKQLRKKCMDLIKIAIL
ncbi:MAG: hypothetical protein JXB49_21950 [Bacteroidales bacterium]|nr:hypothetical protein [Bacteroidales bacterium]